MIFFLISLTKSIIIGMRFYRVFFAQNAYYHVLNKNLINNINIDINNQLLDLINTLNQTVKNLQNEINVPREKIDSKINNNVIAESNSN